MEIHAGYLHEKILFSDAKTENAILIKSDGFY